MAITSECQNDSIYITTEKKIKAPGAFILWFYWDKSPFLGLYNKKYIVHMRAFIFMSPKIGAFSNFGVFIDE